MRQVVLVMIGMLLASGGFALEVSVRDYGAVGNGQTDDTAAFQAALDAVGNALGGIVHAPVGNYRIAGTLRVPRDTTLAGVAVAPAAWNENRATTLLASAGAGEATGTPFISLMDHNATIQGLTVFYPNQIMDSTPVAYPWTCDAVRGDNHTILDVLLVNPYQAIRLHSVGRHLVRNVYGRPLYRGISIDRILDVGRIENVHFWPFAGGWDANGPLAVWMRDNSVAFEFGRSDWQSVLNTFCFGYGAGYRFYRSAHGTTNGTLVGIGADHCRTAVRVDAAEAIGVLITNGQFVGNWGDDSAGLYVGPGHNGIVSLSNCSFWGSSAHIAVLDGEGRVSFDNCLFKQWDKHSRGDFAIEHRRGSLSVQGCDFWSPGRDIHISPHVRAAFVIGNESGDGLEVWNEAGTRAQIAYNSGSAASPSMEMTGGE